MHEKGRVPNCFREILLRVVNFEQTLLRADVMVKVAPTEERRASDGAIGLQPFGCARSWYRRGIASAVVPELRCSGEIASDFGI